MLTDDLSTDIKRVWTHIYHNRISRFSTSRVPVKRCGTCSHVEAKGWTECFKKYRSFCCSAKLVSSTQYGEMSKTKLTLTVIMDSTALLFNTATTSGDLLEQYDDLIGFQSNITLQGSKSCLIFSFFVVQNPIERLIMKKRMSWANKL